MCRETSGQAEEFCAWENDRSKSVLMSILHPRFVLASLRRIGVIVVSAVDIIHWLLWGE